MEKEKDLDSLLQERREKNAKDFKEYLEKGLEIYKCKIVPQVTIIGNEVVADILIKAE